MRQEILCPRPPFNQQPAQEPDPQGAHDPESWLRIVLIDRKAEGRSNVVLLLVQPPQPVAALRREEICLCLRRERQHVGRVPLLHQVAFACPIELFQRVLAQGLQHREARLAIAAFTLLNEALVDQRGHTVEDVETEVT
jgi:hypothetical protein